MQSISSTALFMILFIVFVLFMIYSAMLLYHWFRYAMSTPVAISASIVYMGTGFVLLFVMITSASSLM